MLNKDKSDPQLTCPIVACTFGVWDMLHVGHVKFLQAAKANVGPHGRLLVGVPGDGVVMADKGRLPIITLVDRIEMLEAIKYVDEVFPYFKLEFARYLEIFKPDLFIIGEQWGNEKRHGEALEWCEQNNRRVIQLPYHSHESSTAIKKRVLEQVEIKLK